jgi:hypothetical protein
MACQPSEPEAPVETPPETTAEAPAAEMGVVDVTLEDYSFLAPPRLRSGWTTFRMTNNGEQPHFMLFWRLPDDKTFDEYAAEVSQPFQEEFDRFYAGEVSRDEMLENVVGRLPEWFGTVQGMGGVGLTSPGRTSETSVLLEPGDYVMECYVISPEGKFHGVQLRDEHRGRGRCG